MSSLINIQMPPQNAHRRRTQGNCPKPNKDDTVTSQTNDTIKTIPKRKRRFHHTPNRTTTVLSFAAYLLTSIPYRGSGGGFCDGLVVAVPSLSRTMAVVGGVRVFKRRHTSEYCNDGNAGIHLKTTVLFSKQRQQQQQRRRQRQRKRNPTITPPLNTTSSSFPPLLPLDQYEKREKRELEWLVKSTSQILSISSSSSSSSPSIPPLPPATIHKILPVASTWVRRTSQSPDRSSSVRAAHVVGKLLVRYRREIQREGYDGGGGREEEEEEEEGETMMGLYNLWMEAWAKGSDVRDGEVLIRREGEGEVMTSPERAQEILDGLEGMEGMEEVEKDGVKPDLRSYYMCLRAWVRCQGGDVALGKMEVILERMEAGRVPTPTETSTTTTTVHPPKPPPKQLDDNHNNDHDGGKEGRTATPLPTYVRCYNLYLYALANVRSNHRRTGTTSVHSPGDIVEKAMGVLERLERRSEELRIAKRKGRRRRRRRRRRRLEDKEEEGDGGDGGEEEEEDGEDASLWTPDTDTYHQVISCLSKLRTVEGARRAQSVYDSIFSGGDDDDDDDDDDGSGREVRPDTSTSNELMSCWLHIRPSSNDDDGYAVGYKNDEDDADYHGDDDDNHNPSSKPPKPKPKQKPKRNQHQKSIYTSNERIERIESILQRMNQYRLEGFLDCAPDCISVNTYMTVIVKQQQEGKKNAAAAAAVVRRVESILEGMEVEYGVEPDQISYNLVMDAHSNSRDKRAFLKVERILTSMEEAYLDGHETLRPDTFSYTTAINAIPQNRHDSGKRATAILKRMENMYHNHRGDRPTTPVYNAVMNSWVKKSGRLGISRITSILNKMEALSDDTTAPNTISYNTLLKAYSRIPRGVTDIHPVHESERLLSHMERLYNENPAGHVVPDVVTYSTVITTYARSVNVPHKARGAIETLKRLIASYEGGNARAKPSIITFNACLNACAYTTAPEEKTDAFLFVLSTLVSLEKYTKPDHITYGTLMRALSNLLREDDDRRNRVVRSVWEQCREEGMVGSMVLQQMKFAASPDVFLELVGKDVLEREEENEEQDEIRVSSLPADWSRNVSDRDKRGSTS